MILVALGANLNSSHGTPEQTIRAAILALEYAGVRVLKQSTIWLTTPVPASDQPLYRNAVIAVDASCSPADLLALLHDIEAAFGRVRKTRNEARVLDLDLIAYHDVVLGGADIALPHPRLHERAFVLVPLCEIDPQWMHPVLRLSARTLLDRLPDQNAIATMQSAA